MVEETIRSIRETESRAADKVREAEEESHKILTEAQEEAARKREAVISSARAEAQKIAEAARVSGEKAGAGADGKTAEVVKALKEAAKANMPAAVDLVVSRLV